MNSGETLIYLDAGSSLNSGTVSTNRLRQYVEMSANSGALFFQQKLTEKAWTKSSLRKTFPEDSHWESGQALGGIMVLNSSPVTLEFLDHISGLARHNNYEALLEPGVDEVQDDAFVAHRHDQSIISLAAKDTTFTMIPDETYFAPNWPQAGKDYPIWASRLCSGNDDLSGTIGNRVRREIERRLPF